MWHLIFGLFIHFLFSVTNDNFFARINLEFFEDRKELKKVIFQRKIVCREKKRKQDFVLRRQIWNFKV